MISKNGSQTFCLLTIIVSMLLSYHFANAQHPNIMVGCKIDGRNPQEPTITLNPKNANQMVAGANLDNYYISTDGGQTWTHGHLQSPQGVWGDPCVIVDTTGSFYFFHLSNPPGEPWVDRIVCQKLTHPDATWSAGTYMGLNGSKLQDKEWATVDVKNNYIYVCWTQFDQYGNPDPKFKSNIMFSRSTDGGQTWSVAKQINQYSGDCLDDDNTVEGAVPAVGPSGEIYVAWGSPKGLVFDRSFDYGETWLSEDIFIADLPGGWALDVPGINRCNGMPVTVCDVSDGPYHGNIYVNWSDQRNGIDDTDIWLSKSSDSGDTWSERIRVNDDPPGRHQFFSWMATDQTNGYIYIVFYDRRNHTNNLTDVYLAVSRDGGETFSNNKISESTFNPQKSVFFGDYTNIAAHNNVIRPIWARLDEYDLSLWTAIVKPDLLTEARKSLPVAKPTGFEILSVHPNPFNSTTTVRYQLTDAGKTAVKVFDVLGKEVVVLFNGDQSMGDHQIIWNAENFASGVYFIHLEFNDLIKTEKVVIAR